MLNKIITIIQKHLKYRKCDDEFYISHEGLSAMKGEILASVIQWETEQPDGCSDYHRGFNDGLTAAANRESVLKRESGREAHFKKYLEVIAAEQDDHLHFDAQSYAQQALDEATHIEGQS